MVKDLDCVDILGVEVARLTAADALATVEEVADEGNRGEPAVVCYANAHTLNLAHRNDAYRALLNEASIVLNDGSGLAVAARINGTKFPENLNGTDLNPQILRIAARRGWPVFFLGGAPGVAREAATSLCARIEGLEVVGITDGYADVDRAVEEVRASGARLVMVGMGNPLQERWLSSNLSSTGARLGIGVGAFFDFEAGRVQRAPGWMRRAGIEWVWRLKLEPARLWRRYVLGNPLFLARVVAARARRLRLPLAN